MEISSFLTAAIGLTIAGVIKGATGIGYASCALPFLVLTFGLKPAMALVVFPAMATNVSQLLQAGHLKDVLCRFCWLYAAILPGIAVGIVATNGISSLDAARILGAVTVSYALVAVFRPGLALRSGTARALMVPAGVVNGVMTGLTGAQVMPLVPYVMSLRLEPAISLQAINVAVFISSTALAFGLASTGDLNTQVFSASVAAILPALIGLGIGNRARTLLSPERFRRVVLLTLFVLGAIMLGK